MDTTKQPVPMPQDRRTMAILLGAVGGCLDVFSHIQFSTLIATQTGNIILIVADWDGPTVKTAYRILSLVFFTCGFILGILLKERAQSSHWRTWGVLPLTLSFFSFSLFYLGDITCNLYRHGHANLYRLKNRVLSLHDYDDFRKLSENGHCLV